MKKYKGDYKTKLRVRFKLSNSIYVSSAFEGFINRDQFLIRDSSYFKRQLQESDGKDARWLFYGASIKKEKWSNRQ